MEREGDCMNFFVLLYSKRNMGEAVDLLQGSVRYWLARGWRVAGGVTLAWKPPQLDGSGDVWVVAQPMVRDVQESSEKGG
jgi:hypothetical protein